MSKIEALRIEIARNYCRSILWVDDEIRFPGKYSEPALFEPFTNLFLPIAEFFQRQGVLCQLQPVSLPDTTVDVDAEPQELVVVKRLAEVADIVILDWHLADDESPKHSISVINHLLEQRETRLIVILTKESRVISEFKKEFGQFHFTGDIASSENGKHVVFVAKPKGGGDKAGQMILDAIDHLMMGVFPDYIHWAALEIAGDIKKFAPQWLESLPRGMNWALLSEYCYGKEAAAELLVENLLEDLSHCIRPSQLKSTHPDNCKGADWIDLEGHIAKQHGLEDGDELSILSLSEDPPKIHNGLPDGFVKPTNDVIKEFVASQKLFNTFCENISPDAAQVTGIAPGSVFQKTGTTGNREIIVCVSQGCDCLRGKELLFVRGKKAKTTKLGSTIVKFQQQCYRFEAEAKNLSVLKINAVDGNRVPEGLTKIGQFRAATTRRLAARFWNYATRSAVNHSAYARAERRDE